MTNDITTTPPAEEKARKKAAVRRFVLRQLVFELGLPLGCYYALRGAGVSPWAALLAGGLLAVPWIVHGMIRHRRVETMAVFTLVVLLVGSLMTLVTGDPRTLLVRDSWLAAVIGIWVLATVPTRNPFLLSAFRPMIVAKVGEDGYQQWRSRWTTEPDFRRHVRILSAVWGVVLTLDAGVRVVLALTVPVDAVPTASTAQWLVVLAGLILFHRRYVMTKGLEA
ncbi:hypothetical protein GCM10010218_22240 [Streptomyces mashuensis]|uniref:Intracellular septation protein A n=1 Tax=Streptomyces mashuensis TaxID=33904 RepID=A0A919EB86_9ACTN|nr:VC0807 family protein [Streptomyces mashuensis]GHF40430.1 hypothetical protein GCM10010218_22240 [Streptomyces mashuensis]